MQNPVSGHLRLSDQGRRRLTNVGRQLLDKGKKVGASVKSTGGEIVDVVRDKDTVELGSSYQRFTWEQNKNFAMGVYQWGKDGVETVINVAKDPVGTAKAVGNLATNPLLNPVAGLARGTLEGKSVGETYRDGANQLLDIGKGIGQGYADVYKERGVAGVAGYVAPDIALAFLTGGSSAAASGARAATKGTAKAVVKEAAKDATQEVAGATGRHGAKDIAKEFIPGPEDSVDVLNEAKEKDARPWGALGHLFDAIG